MGFRASTPPPRIIKAGGEVDEGPVFMIMSLSELSPWNILCIPSTRVAISRPTFVSYILPPLLSYFAFAVLTVQPQTRSLQVALWPIVALLALRGALSVDIALGLAEWEFLDLHLVLLMSVIATRTLDWTIAREPPVRHIRPKHATPSTIMDGFDLAFNLRGYGWNWSRGLYVPRETRPSGRTAFIAYSIFSVITHAFFCGIAHAAVQSSSPELGTLAGGTFFDDTLPFFVKYLRAAILAVLGALVNYHGLQLFYIPCTIIGVLVFGQDPAQWPPAFDAPWRATSIGDFWGRRWHQFFRQTFIFVGGYPLSLVFGRVGFVIGAFLVSAFFHHFSITPKGDIETNLVSFAMMAIALLAERAFKHVTGKKVGGWAGWIWTMSWMVFWGTPMVDGWARVGTYGSPSLISRLPMMRGLVERSVTAFDSWLHTL